MFITLAPHSTMTEAKKRLTVAYITNNTYKETRGYCFGCIKIQYKHMNNRQDNKQHESFCYHIHKRHENTAV